LWEGQARVRKFENKKKKHNQLGAEEEGWKKLLQTSTKDHGPTLGPSVAARQP